MALHRVGSPTCCRRLTHATLCSDVALSRVVEARGVTALLDWQPGRTRRADWAEAAIGATWLAGGWPAASCCISTLLHPGVVAEAPGIDLPGERERLAAAAQLGSHVLEVAAAVMLYRDS